MPHPRYDIIKTESTGFRLVDSVVLFDQRVTCLRMTT